MEKLKPCPFCGGEAEIINKGDKFHPDRFVPRCKGKYCIGRNIKYFPSEHCAAIIWNGRAKDGEQE